MSESIIELIDEQLKWLDEQDRKRKLRPKKQNVAQKHTANIVHKEINVNLVESVKTETIFAAPTPNKRKAVESPDIIFSAQEKIPKIMEHQGAIELN